MRVVVNKKSELGQILTAVYYKSPAMPLDVPNLWNTLDSASQALLRTSGKAQEIRYDAGELGVDYRFFEYGLQYFPNPDGILPAVSEGMADTLFRNSSGTWIGTGEFKDIGKYIIPTNTSMSGRSGIKFFGSFQTSTQEIYTFPAGPGISKIELYDCNIEPSEISGIYDADLGYSNEYREHLIISFYLGCSGELSGTPRWSNNFKSEYFIGDVQRDIDLDWKLYSERFDSKVVFLSVSQRREKNLQVSYNAWLKLYEPLRNKPSYDVLLSEKTKDPTQTGETIKGHKFDLASGSYLGSLDSRPKPILEEKLRKQAKLDSGNMYNAWRRYGPGDIARYDGKLWVSLCQDNCGNTPEYSGKWVLQDRTTDFYTSWFIVKCQDAKEIVPGAKINVPDYQKESAFEVYPKPGYIPTEANVNSLGKDKTISRVVMTENVDLDEKRYYIFYVKWDPKEKANGNIRGRVLELRLEKKPLSPVIRIPDFIVQRYQGKYELTWNNNIDSFNLEVPGKNIVIDDPLDCSIIDNIRLKVAPGTGLTKKQADDAFESFIEKLEFTLEYEKSVPGETWETGGSEVEPVVKVFSSSNMISDIILHEDKVDYETCKYTLIPGWSYKKVTVSNSGDFDIEYPVFDVIRTEDYRSGVFSRTGVRPSELMIKYRLDYGEWSEWQHASFNGSEASWYHPGGGHRNEVHLDRDGDDLYKLQVKSVTIDLIIDIKV
jgi:hypothetical protein